MNKEKYISDESAFPKHYTDCVHWFIWVKNMYPIPLCDLYIKISKGCPVECKKYVRKEGKIDKLNEQKKLEKPFEEPLNEKIIAVKKIINDNPDDNYSLVLKEFGQEFIDHNIAIGTFFEISKGKQLVFIVGGW